MRIALLSESKEFGGAEEYLLSLAEGVSSLGHEVLFLIPAGAGWRPRGGPAPRVIYECPFHAGALLPFRLGWLASVLRRTRPDILHINLPSTYSASFTAAAPVARTMGCRVVTTEHLSMVGRSRRRALLKDAFTRHVHRIIAVSKATQLCLCGDHRLSRSKIEVIHNGVDIEKLSFASREQARASLGIDDDAAAIGCVGELIVRKGHRHLVEAISEVASCYPGPMQVVIVGGGEERGSLQKQIKELDLEGSVRLVGRIDRAGSLLRAFDLFVMPSLMEALPFALLEAMAAGLPAVATSVWGIPEVVVEGQTGLLVPPGDPQRLAKAVLKLLWDKDLRRRMGEKAMSVVSERFSLKIMAGKTVSVYERVMGESQPAAARPSLTSVAH